MPGRLRRLGALRSGLESAAPVPLDPPWLSRCRPFILEGGVESARIG